MPPRRRLPPIVPRIALALASVALVLLVAEAAVRLIVGDQSGRFRRLPPRMPEAWRDLPKIGRDASETLRRPGARGTIAGALIEMNEHGLRGPARSVEKPDDVFRIALIGDSVTMGWGVLYEETYGAIIEGRLDQRSPDRRIEVLNLGLAGYDTTQLMDRLWLHGLAFEPDLFVYGFTINDVEGEHYQRFAEGGYRDPRKYLHARSHLLRFLGPRIDALRDFIAPPRDSYTYELHYNYFENPAAWADVEVGLHRLSDWANHRDACVLVLIHTHLTSLRFMHPFHGEYEKIRTSAEARGFAVVHSWPEHAGEDEEQLWVTAFDHHPNVRGHALLADSLTRGLDALPESCWASAKTRRGATH